jgi:carbamoyl-phosphate synthase large subunit
VNGAGELALAVGGAALLGGAVTWRLTTRRGARATLRTALASANPASRIAALNIVASEGVAAYVDLLRQRAAVESDPEVRRTLAEVIARSQWEPVDDQALVELRLWAHRLLNSAPTPTLSDFAGRSRQDDSPHEDPLEVEAEVPETGSRSGGEPGGSDQPGRRQEPDWSLRVPREPDPTIVLVTGAGGPAGTSVIRWLRAAGHHVVAADADPTAVGLRLGDEAAVIRRFDDPEYLRSLCEVARSTRSRVLVPTIAEELLALAPGRDLLEGAGLDFFLPEPDAVLDCIDKWRFAKVAQAAGVSVPATNIGSADGVPGPWVVKPRRGRGSRDVVLADDETGLRYALANVPEPIVQTRVTGREFTADLLVAPNGELAGVVPRWRLETRGGISSKGRTFLDPGLILDVAHLMEALGLRGPANVQGFVGDDGAARFIEVNPRFSGGLPLSLAAGADLVGEFVRAARGLPVRPERCSFRPGVVMLRYFEDVFEG